MTTVETCLVAGEGLTALMSGETTYLVGVEDGPDGSLKAYVGHRSRGVYCLIDDPEAQAAPPECLFCDAVESSAPLVGEG
jgi:hypothetical protein